jgi:copper transport outer membrane protein MctB
VIDFRYHLVSIVAVFLALAIGIVLGSTELQGHTIDALNATSNLLRGELNAANAARDGYQTQANASEQFLQSAEPKLLGGTLTGHRVVIVAEPGAQGSLIDGVKQAAQNAGASVTGQVALLPKFFDLSGATQSSLSVINSSIAGPDGIVFNTVANPQTGYQQQAAQLIATAILVKSAGSGSILTAPSAQSLLTAYAQAGYLNVSGPVTNGATLAVIVTPQTAPSDGANDPASQVLLAVAQEFAGLSAATVVAGSTAGSSQPGSAISVLRSSSVSSAVSSVDNADTTLGQITVMQALGVQLAGVKPNSYGVSGASAVGPVVPSPSVSPSSSASTSPPASPSASPSAHPTATATGKGGRPVKRK